MNDSTDAPIRWRSIPRQSLLALVIFATVSCVNVWICWRVYGNAGNFGYPASSSMYRMERLMAFVEEYKRREGKLPANLKELESIELDGDEFAEWQGLNAWEHPFVYETHSESYRVIDLGRDGKVAGSGLDADVTSDDMDPIRSFPTLHQFLFDLPSQRMVMVSVLGGLLAGLAVLVDGIFKSSTQRPSRRWRLVTTIMGVIIMTVVISILHIPSGH